MSISGMSGAAQPCDRIKARVLGIYINFATWAAEGGLRCPACPGEVLCIALEKVEGGTILT